MRVGELCNLNFEDLHLDNQEITVRDTKTYSDRKVIISKVCVTILTDYIQSVPHEEKALFTSQRGKRISRNRVYTLVRKYAQRAGIQKNVTPHVLRHTLATNMIAHGASVIEVNFRYICIIILNPLPEFFSKDSPFRSSFIK